MVGRMLNHSEFRFQELKNNTMTNNYYSNTAFDLSKKRTLPPSDRTDMNLAQKTIRKHPVSIIANQCQEYLANSNPFSTVLEIKNLSQSKYQQALDL